ncbi:MAG: hypothetical protein U5K74_11720 [Gemmatimonadaceae bacterium]|nr:hypothetical protein [Gemmatimonadaceae bacterium]
MAAVAAPDGPQAIRGDFLATDQSADLVTGDEERALVAAVLVEAILAGRAQQVLRPCARDPAVDATEARRVVLVPLSLPLVSRVPARWRMSAVYQSISCCSLVRKRSIRLP